MKKTLSLFCVLFLSGASVAEPTPSIRWAMDQNASLFELAFMRLEMQLKLDWVPDALEKLPFEVSEFASPNISYDWDTNSVRFSAGVYEIPDVVKPNKQACELLLEVVAKEMNYDKNGFFSSDDYIDLHPIAEAFSHRGFDVTTTPDSYSRNVLNATQLNMALIWYKDEAGVKSMDGIGTCSTNWATGSTSFDSGWD